MSDTSKRVDICFVGPLPPPTHGMANVNLAMITELSRHAKLSLIAVNPAPGASGLRAHLTKSLRALLAFPRIAGARAAGARVFYASVDDGLGGIWTCGFVVLARWLGYRIHLHHHSFRYLNEPTRIMRAIVRAAGLDSLHIALCNDMAAALRQSYPRIGKMVAVPNSVTLPPRGQTGRVGNGQYVIGMLSNLMFEKGVKEFVEIVRCATHAGLPVRGILAGPAPNSQIKRFLDDVLDDPGLPLEWRGHLEGKAKQDFFRDIDLFVFPTKYRTEAYPLVLLEALTNGVPIVAPRRGCIGAFDALRSAAVIPLTENFVEATVRLLKEGRFPPLPATRQQARQDGEKLNCENASTQNALIDHLLASI